VHTARTIVRASTNSTNDARNDASTVGPSSFQTFISLPRKTSRRAGCFACPPDPAGTVPSQGMPVSQVAQPGTYRYTQGCALIDMLYRVHLINQFPLQAARA